MTGHLDGLPAEELRALIRDVLRDVLPVAIGRAQGAAAPTSNGAPTSTAAPTGTAAPAGKSATPPSGLPAGQPPATTVPATAVPATAVPDTTKVHASRQTAARQVRLETDADVRQFALDILRLADNPARRRDLLTGRLTYTLARRAGDDAAPGDHRIETGAVTERLVASAAKAGQRLVLGPRAVLTPLARDRALALGVPIERER
jgi:hypothetical protein